MRAVRDRAAFALITGASKGLGVELAREFAKRGFDLILSARDERSLREIAAEIADQYGRHVEVVAGDLARGSERERLAECVATLGAPLEVLVNNATVGSYGPFTSIPENEETQLFEIDIAAVVHLSKLLVPAMVERHRGYVLNVASIGAYAPTPLYASFSAAKTFVLSFSVALGVELRGSGVSVTVVSPGVSVPEGTILAIERSTRYQRASHLSNATVARRAVKATLERRATFIPGLVNRLTALVARLAPSGVALRMAYNLMKSEDSRPAGPAIRVPRLELQADLDPLPAAVESHEVLVGYASSVDTRPMTFPLAKIDRPLFKEAKASAIPKPQTIRKALATSANDILEIHMKNDALGAKNGAAALITPEPAAMQEPAEIADVSAPESVVPEEVVAPAEIVAVSEVPGESNDVSLEEQPSPVPHTAPIMQDVVSTVPEPALAEPKQASHDDGPPAALLAFMLTDWDAKAGLPEPLAEAARFRKRRERLSAMFPGDVIVVATGREKVRANDTNYRFRAGTDFYYLTGNVEPDAVLVMRPSAAGHDAVLYVQPNAGKTDATFFTDRSRGELWVGPRLGVDESAARFGIEARALPDLERTLETVASEGAVRPVRSLAGFDSAVDAALGQVSEKDDRLATALSEMRLIKDDHEVRELERAIASTGRGFDDVVRALPTSTSERHVEGLFNLRARVEGNDVGYGTIAAAGSHACTLHWTANDGPLEAGELLLLDAGVETNELYTADVTRTIPISGRFSREQREIYDLVLAAQYAAIEMCAPGNDFMAPNAAAMSVLAYGLESLGILPMSAEVALRETNQFYKRYSLHNVSHMLGLDVHDCAKARLETYKYGKLEEGMVLTVEPGLYLQPDDRTVPERYRGIGVRIEDDVLITSHGCRVLSIGIPRQTSAVEAWVRNATA